MSISKNNSLIPGTASLSSVQNITGRDFSASLSILNISGQVTEWQRAVATHDTTAYLKLKNPITVMYDSISTLAPQTQMFMMGCSKELNDKYDRLQCRDIIMRNILAFSAGVQKTMYWDLWNNTDNKYDLMTLMFGKNKLVEYDNGKVIKEYPEVDVFKRMTGYLKDY